MSNLDTAGWGYPAGANTRKVHWWPVGSDRSGCGKYGRTLTTVRPDEPDPRHACAACSRKAAAA